MTPTQQIGRTRNELRTAKPRSRRRVELETRLRILVLQQIRREIRSERRAMKG
jgi:hypothetical protein